jgi:hypothetical protein
MCVLLWFNDVSIYVNMIYNMYPLLSELLTAAVGTDFGPPRRDGIATSTGTGPSLNFLRPFGKLTCQWETPSWTGSSSPLLYEISRRYVLLIKKHQLQDRQAASSAETKVAGDAATCWGAEGGHIGVQLETGCRGRSGTTAALDGSSILVEIREFCWSMFKSLAVRFIRSRGLYESKIKIGK